MHLLVLFSATALILSAPGTLFGQSCKIESLRGNYAGTVSGRNVSDVPVAYQAIAQFDGAGHFSLAGFTYVANGAVVVSNGSASGGTYSVNPDCSGSIQISSNGQTFAFAILLTAPDLSQFQMLETDGSATTTGNAVKQETRGGPHS
jgi:hypothetical protein